MCKLFRSIRWCKCRKIEITTIAIFWWFIPWIKMIVNFWSQKLANTYYQCHNHSFLLTPTLKTRTCVMRWSIMDQLKFNPSLIKIAKPYKLPTLSWLGIDTSTMMVKLEHCQWALVTCGHQRSFDGPPGQCGPVVWGSAEQVPQRSTRHAVSIPILKTTVAWACRSIKSNTKVKQIKVNVIQKSK